MRLKYMVLCIKSHSYGCLSVKIPVKKSLFVSYHIAFPIIPTIRKTRRRKICENFMLLMTKNTWMVATRLMIEWFS